MDGRGALYGTAAFGGKFNGGVVFKLAGKKETVLKAFKGYRSGFLPIAGLIMGTLRGVSMARQIAAVTTAAIAE